MNPRHEEDRIALRRFRRQGLPLALIAGSLVLLQASECKKGRDFYAPLGITSGVTDNTGPLITDFLPGPNVILNDVVVMSTITDPQGSNGATPSGVDVSSITAIGDDGADLSVATAGTNMHNADIAAWGDGLHMIDWTALDLAGNEGTGNQTITIDRTDPVVNVNPTPPATATSDDLQFSWNVGINLVEPHLLSATYTVTLAGNDGICGNSDDVTPTAEQVPTSTFPLQSAANTIEVVTNNGVAPGGQPRTAVYCGAITALDTAVTKTGGSASNTTTTPPFRTELIWMAPSGGGDFTVVLNDPPPGWLHDMPGVSSLECKVIQTSPPQPGAAFSASATGPTEGGASGVLTPQPVTGTLDSNGRAQLQVRINRLGTYQNTVTVTVGGVPRSATQTITVLSTPNTCPVLPSSMRFKRGVVALLPDDVRPLGLRPVAFRYVEPYGDPAVPRIGLIAEEVAEVFPEAVLLDAGGRPEAIDYRVLTGRILEEVEARALGAVDAAVAHLAGVL